MKRHINSYSPTERREIMVNRLSAIVLLNGGTFNADEYINKRSKIKFSCAIKHEWVTQAQSVINGSWCRICWETNGAGKHFQLRDGLAQAKKIALERGGVCISENYERTTSKMGWQCANGHIWKSTLSDIKKGTWCPDCANGVRERMVRHYFELITCLKFPKARPSWLLNSRGNRMELDGFCESFYLAFEHQGKQHYEEVPHFNRRAETLETRRLDDEEKRKKCKARGIRLIEIPYTISLHTLPDWIYQEIKGIDASLVKIAHKEVSKAKYVPSNELFELKSLAQGLGGDCLSTIFNGSDKKHLFLCGKGHKWEALASNVKLGTWCPICKPDRIGDSNRKHTVQSMNALAAKKGGKFTSTDFKSVNNKYEWECSRGHRWLACPTDVTKGSWCESCTTIERQEKLLKEFQQLAQSRGGACLSKEYIDSYTKLKFCCSEGHEWLARPGNVKNSKAWCPQCAKLRHKGS
jgi:hypothetical protein